MSKSKMMMAGLVVAGAVVWYRRNRPSKTTVRPELSAFQASRM